MKKLFFTSVLFLTALNLFSAETIYYETKGNGGRFDWFDANCWKDGKIPPTNWNGGLFQAHELKQTSKIFPIRYYHHNVTIKAGDTIEMNYNFTIQNGGVLNIQSTGAFQVKKFRIYNGGSISVYGDFYITEKLEQSWASNGSNIYVGNTGYIGVNGNISVGAGANFVNHGDVATTETEDGSDHNRSPFGTIEGNDVHYEQNPVIPKPSNFLPIELKSFTVSVKNNLANFLWVTATEENNDFFEIEQSYDLKNWNTVHMQFGAGNSYSELEYTATLELSSSSNVSYFRLKQTDYDGKYSYSKIISAENTNNSPELRVGFIDDNIFIDQDYNILRVYNVQGRLLATYQNQKVINNLPEKGILLFIFDNNYTQKILLS